MTPPRTTAPQAGATLPSHPFFHTVEQRTLLARQRFFDEGERPSGLVPDPVFQSWVRCMREGRAPTERPSLEPVSRSRTSAVLARNHALLEVARDDLSQLENALAGTPVKAILTDRQGVVIRATRAERHEGAVLQAGCRVGVDLGELHMGTAAPGLSVSTHRACTVRGPEHFFANICTMYCAAAPIHDSRGVLVGVLDLSVEHRPFGFDAATLVGMTATSIENRLLVRQSREQVLVRFQTLPGYLGTPQEAMAAVDLQGRLAWINPAAAGLLGCTVDAARGQDAEAVLGTGLAGWLRQAGQATPFLCRMPSGLNVWAQVRLPAGPTLRALGTPGDPPPGRPSSEPVPSPTTEATATGPGATATPARRASLAQASSLLIEQTLAACGGNISRAATTLGVSRGLLYRRLRSAPPGPDE